jgi:hypothetical protein
LPSLQTVSGSGDFKDASLISFSYAEDASPISPANLNGGTGQVSAQLVQNEASRGSRIAINNEALLSDEEYGDINFTIKKLSLNEGLVSITGSTIQARLDVDRIALPQGSDASGYNLYEAIDYYCSIVGVVPNFEAGLQEKLEAIEVDFIGWEGNVWEHLKMLCSAHPVDDYDTLMEMYIVNDELWFREALSATLETSSLISSESIEIDAYDAAQTVKLAKYSTDYRADSLIRQQNIATFNYANLELVSITDSFQVQANEKITRRVLVNASLESVDSVIVPVQSVQFPITYSQYVIVGKDEVPLTPAQWLGQGGSLEVTLTENPNEIEITITGPNYPELEPFKIGVESSGGEDYPAFYIRGTGVFFERTEHTLYTGAPESEIGEASLIDNPFIVNDEIFWSAAARINRELCGPTFTFNQSIPTGVDFGTTTGSIVEAFDSKFRIEKTNFSQTGVTIEGSSYVTFADFNAAWSGDDISDFDTSMDGLTFNEFSIAALTKG